MNRQKFIDLDRHFAVLSHDQPYEEPLEIPSFRYGKTKPITWEDLFNKRLVIVLAEAGSGKTEEMLASCRKLRSIGKASFFFRLEHLTSDFEAAFEIGDLTEFRSWIESNSEAWIFLDSVDEARLKGPKEFESAIRKFAIELGSSQSRCHLYVSSRVTEWRPKSDFSLILSQLAQPRFLKQNESNQPDRQASHERVRESQTITQDSREGESSVPEVFGLCSLNQEQIAKFCDEVGLSNRDEFLHQLRRHDAMFFAARPQDLIDLIDYWKMNSRIGSRYELISNSLDKRLTEKDQDRALDKDLPFAKAKDGAIVLAAASTMMKLSRIRIPGADRVDALIPHEVLNGWSERECSALLERPIFDKAIYGAVRFHHRIVREFLVARWILDRLSHNENRTGIEHLFFRKQYDIDVIVPTMRPIVAWVALEDDRILNRALQISPDVLIEFGDPTRLPMSCRIQILRAYCLQQKEGHQDHFSIDRAALLRFSHSELVPTIRSLLGEYRDCRDALDTLILLILHGELKLLRFEVRSICEDEPLDVYSRVIAIRALAKIGSEEDKSSCVARILSDDSALGEEIFAELLCSFGSKLVTPERFASVLERFPCSSEHQNGKLLNAIEQYLESLNPEQVMTVIRRFKELLIRMPFIRKECKVSSDFCWLIESSAKAAASLVRNKNSHALSDDALLVLDLIKNFQCFGNGARLKHDLDLLVPKFDSLNWKLFWRSVAQSRDDALKEGKKIERWWQCNQWNSFWSIENVNFQDCVNDVLTKVDDNDKLILLSLAFTIYCKNDRPRTWYRVLKNLVNGRPMLADQLNQLFHPEPKSQESKRIDRMQAGLRQKRKANEAKEVERHAAWQSYLKKHIAQLKDVSVARSGSVWNSQLYLFDELRRIENNHAHWACANWRDLIPKHGEEVAKAFRDGLVNYWRHYKPRIRSEGVEDPNSVPYAVSIALSGIEIESREAPNWPSYLTDEEAELAIRMSLWEMNGFPDWLPRLHRCFPEPVRRLFIQEIEWELTERVETDSFYVLNYVKWSGQWVYDDLAWELLSLLSTSAPKGNPILIDLLWIIVRSTNTSNEQIAQVAELEFKRTIEVKRKAIWSAIWLDVDAEQALDEISQFITTIPKAEKTQFVVEFLTALLGKSGAQALCHRMNFRSPEILSSLYALVCTYVRFEEDIERAGQGVYSPTSRDHAQRARSSPYGQKSRTTEKGLKMFFVDLIFER